MKRRSPASPWREQRRRQRGYRPRALVGLNALPTASPPGAGAHHRAGGGPLGHFLATARSWGDQFGKAPKTVAAHVSAREQISFFFNEVCHGSSEQCSPTDSLIAFSTWLITRPPRSGPRGTWSKCTPQSARQYVASTAVAMGWKYDEEALEAHYTSARRRHLVLHGPAEAPTKADMSAGILRAIVRTTEFPRLAAWAANGAIGAPPALEPKQADEVMAAVGLIWCFCFGMRLSDLTPPTRKGFNPNTRMTAGDVCLEGAAIRFRTKVLKNDRFASKFRRWSAAVQPQQGLNILCPATAWAVRLATYPAGNDHQPLLPAHNGDPVSAPSLRRLAKRGVGLARAGATTLSCRHGCASALVNAGTSAEIVSQYQRWSTSGSWAAYASIDDGLAAQLLTILIG